MVLIASVPDLCIHFTLLAYLKPIAELSLPANLLIFKLSETIMPDSCQSKYKGV